MDPRGLIRMDALFARPTSQSVLASMRAARQDAYEWPPWLDVFEVVPFSKGGEESRRSVHHSKADSKHKGDGEDGRRTGDRSGRPPPAASKPEFRKPDGEWVAKSKGIFKSDNSSPAFSRHDDPWDMPVDADFSLESDAFESRKREVEAMRLSGHTAYGGGLEHDDAIVHQGDVEVPTHDIVAGGGDVSGLLAGVLAGGKHQGDAPAAPLPFTLASDSGVSGPSPPPPAVAAVSVKVPEPAPRTSNTGFFTAGSMTTVADHAAGAFRGGLGVGLWKPGGKAKEPSVGGWGDKPKDAVSASGWGDGWGGEPSVASTTLTPATPSQSGDGFMSGLSGSSGTPISGSHMPAAVPVRNGASTAHPGSDGVSVAMPASGGFDVSALARQVAANSSVPVTAPVPPPTAGPAATGAASVLLADPAIVRSSAAPPLAVSILPTPTPLKTPEVSGKQPAILEMLFASARKAGMSQPPAGITAASVGVPPLSVPSSSSSSAAPAPGVVDVRALLANARVAASASVPALAPAPAPVPAPPVAPLSVPTPSPAPLLGPVSDGLKPVPTPAPYPTSGGHAGRPVVGMPPPPQPQGYGYYRPQMPYGMGPPPPMYPVHPGMMQGVHPMYVGMPYPQAYPPGVRPRPGPVPVPGHWHDPGAGWYGVPPAVDMEKMARGST